MNLFTSAYSAMEQPGGVLSIKLEEAVLNKDGIPGGKENIPLVDDEEQVVKLARKVLNKPGYNVHARTIRSVLDNSV